MSREDELARIEAYIRALEDAKASGAMPAELADALIAEQRAKQETYRAALQGDGAIAQGEGATATGERGVSVGGDAKQSLINTGALRIDGNVYLGPGTTDPAEALRIYREVLRRSTAILPLRGLDLDASDPRAHKAIRLTQVYVDLDTRGSFSVVEAVARYRALVLLGDPGSGKSTFVNFLTHCLAAHALEPDAGWLTHLPGWPKDEADVLPVPVILRDFARRYADALPSRAEPRHLWDFIVERLRAQNLDFAQKALHDHLEAGRALVLLDGLDEVPTQAQRVFVRDAVRAFMARYGRNRYLITCRVLSYREPKEPDEPDLRLPELPSFEVAPFDDAKIRRFVHAWYAELVRLGAVKREEQRQLTDDLLKAVQKPDLHRLATNPLLLTVMAMVHAHRGRLPEARSLLYDEAINILLWRWEHIKRGGHEGAQSLRHYLAQAGRTDVDLKSVLWALAYDAHAASSATDDKPLADISEHAILKALARLKRDAEHPRGDWNWAQQVVDLMRERAGLLLEREGGVFTLPHRTFQEYLAGCHLAAQTDFATRIRDLAQEDFARWREVALYAVGRLVYVNNDVSKALLAVGELCPAQAPEDEAGWRLAWLAGEALLEIGTVRVGDTAVGRDLLSRVRERLAVLLTEGRLTLRERVRTSDTLAALGDPRFDAARYFLPARRWDPAQGRWLPEPTWGFVRVPAGSFLMGSDPQRDPHALKLEQPQHEVHLDYDYWISRYPVTVAQWRAFAKTTGYEDFGPDALRDPANRPVRWMSWYDARAYARWLDEILRAAASAQAAQASDGAARAFWAGLATGRLRVTLPSEAEWEKAARGADGRIYPWGDDFDPERANARETGLGATSAVGAFPRGASPYGVLDLSGNVWEWTRSAPRAYPYEPADGREDLRRRDVPRILRGGSFYNSPRFVRAAVRHGYDPVDWYWPYGFRLVIVPGSAVSGL